MTTGYEHKRLSELPMAADLEGGELLYLAQGGQPRQVSLAALALGISERLRIAGAPVYSERPLAEGDVLCLEDGTWTNAPRHVMTDGGDF